MPFLGCGGGLGSGGFGAMPFGSGVSGPIESIRQSSMNSIDVTFGVAPRSFDPGDVRDALNPDAWELVPFDPPTAIDRIVQHVEELDPLTMRVYLDGPLDVGASFRLLLSDRVEDASGYPYGGCGIADVGPAFAAFGVGDAPPMLRRGVDLSNPFFPKDSPLGAQGPLGTYVGTATGDLANESGVSYLRKRVLRRATSVESSFFHLPGYGFGLPLKTLIRADRLRTMQSKARSQIMLEPDVESCSVVASYVAADTFAVRLSIKVKSRDGLEVSEDVII